uniref:Uncharacterized protein n=1 Tax=Caenorhabditis japonica TaxID=281687 RepID=A0A8R1I9Z1_CAEJA
MQTRHSKWKKTKQIANRQNRRKPRNRGEKFQKPRKKPHIASVRHVFCTETVTVKTVLEGPPNNLPKNRSALLN